METIIDRVIRGKKPEIMRRHSECNYRGTPKGMDCLGFEIWTPARNLEQKRDWFNSDLNLISNESNFDLIKVEIGNTSYLLDSVHQELKSKIEQSMFILNLPADWDSEGAPQISSQIHSAAMVFLMETAKKIYEESGSDILEMPEINPATNNSIDLSWRTERSRMLINVRNTEKGICAFYYGDTASETEIVKGSVLISTFSRHLFFWIKINLVKPSSKGYFRFGVTL